MLDGASILRRKIVYGWRSAHHQQQPCGIDLTLRRVLQSNAPAIIDFDNSRRKAAETTQLPFRSQDGPVTLAPGAYLAEFNEQVCIPLDVMGEIFTRSSLRRAGATLTAGVVDAGYSGALGAFLDVRNPKGIFPYKDAKLAQICIRMLEEKVTGYHGIHQSSSSTVGRDGPPAVPLDVET
ncbi:uncharacterized protein J7T54_002068 [Emericellopsis cladophorae]|uniref:dUTPase-like domain-containing protein n=1 Tax=Emericellopsis cladophorae TaxID=2686198 RepID=A0A9P9Y4Q0_9HYPO|nr:uncharacterized protein J7T54_002068 [Emericellopsis cladophorae]KAI6782909.1 hypothetical protein J7T54_002068 [Emericellopsis cladophorae]